MAAPEQRKEILERQRDQAEEIPVSLHPNLAGFYRKPIGRLKEALTDAKLENESRRLKQMAADQPLDWLWPLTRINVPA